MTKSKIFSYAPRVKSYQDDVRTIALTKLSTGQKRKNAIFFPDPRKCIDRARAITRQVARYDGDQLEKPPDLYGSALGKEVMQKRKTAIEGIFVMSQVISRCKKSQILGEGEERERDPTTSRSTRDHPKKSLARARVSSL